MEAESNKLQKSCQIYSRCTKGSTEVNLCNMSVAQQMAVSYCHFYDYPYFFLTSTLLISLENDCRMCICPFSTCTHTCTLLINVCESVHAIKLCSTEGHFKQNCFCPPTKILHTLEKEISIGLQKFST